MLIMFGLNCVLDFGGTSTYHLAVFACVAVATIATRTAAVGVVADASGLAACPSLCLSLLWSLLVLVLSTVVAALVSR